MPPSCLPLRRVSEAGSCTLITGPWATCLLRGDSSPSQRGSGVWHPLGDGESCLPGTGSSASSCSQLPLGPCCCMRGGAPSGAPLLPAQLQPHLPPSLQGHLLRDPSPGVPDPKDAPRHHGDHTTPPSPGMAQNSSVQTSALVFNGLFLLPGGGNHLPLPSAASLPPCAGWVLRHPGCWHPAPSKWRCLGLYLCLLGVWAARGETAFAAPWHRLPPCYGCDPAGRGIGYGPLRCEAGNGGPRLCLALGHGGRCAPLSGLGPCGVAEPSFYGRDSAEHGPGSRPRGVSGDTAIVPAPAAGSFLGWGWGGWSPVGAPTLSWGSGALRCWGLAPGSRGDAVGVPGTATVGWHGDPQPGGGTGGSLARR